MIPFGIFPVANNFEVILFFNERMFDKIDQASVQQTEKIRTTIIGLNDNISNSFYLLTLTVYEDEKCNK